MYLSLLLACQLQPHRVEMRVDPFSYLGYERPAKHDDSRHLDKSGTAAAIGSSLISE